MAKRPQWFKMKVQEIFHVRGRGGKDTKTSDRPPLIELSLNLELLMVLVEIILVAYLVLGLLGFVSLF